jgi:hypothetical protein
MKVELNEDIVSDLITDLFMDTPTVKKVEDLQSAGYLTRDKGLAIEDENGQIFIVKIQKR